MRKVMMYCIIIILFIGGCDFLNKEVDVSEMDPKDLPDVPAFQDEFTRGFMASTEEVEDGYYLFQSKTGGYTMMYPEDAKMHRNYFTRSDKYYESIKFGGDREEITGDSYTVRARYVNRKRDIDIDILLEMLSEDIKYEGEYIKNDYKDKTIYFATSEFPGDEEPVYAYDFFGVVKSNNSNQAVSYLYTVYCEDEEVGCDYDVERIENHVKKLMESIEFKHDE